jgi:hypothetical protein
MRCDLRQSSESRGVVACVVLVIYASACTSWHVVGPTPAEYVQTHSPREVRVTRTDSSRANLRTPFLRGDTLLGTVGGGLAVGDTARRVTIPLTDVGAVAVRKFSLSKTLGLYFVIVLPLYAIACGGGGGYGCF